MADIIARDDTPASPKQRPFMGKTSRVVFWAAAATAFLAAAVAIFAPSAGGAAGFMLLGGIAAAGLLLLYALFAGEAAAEWLTPTGAETAERDAARATAGAAFDAFRDPAVILDRSGQPRIANAAFRGLAKRAGVDFQGGRPPGFERIFGGHPGVSAAIYRLSKAAPGPDAEPYRERLPAVTLPGDAAPAAFDLEVTGLGSGETLWRASPRGETPISAGEDVLLDHAPVGFFSAAADGRILYMNATLKDWLGLPADAAGLRLGDFIADGADRALGLGRRATGGSVRADVKLRARDGIETAAVVVTSWPTGPGEPASRSAVFGASHTGAPPGVSQALGADGEGATQDAGLLDTSFAQAPFGIVRLDSGRLDLAVIEDANAAVQGMTSGAAAPGARFRDLFELSDSDAAAAFAAADPHDPTPLEIALAGREAGAGGEVRVYLAPDRAGRAAAFLLDVAADKETERRLFQAQKLNAIGLLAGGVAHDMNNFLQAVRTNTDLLLTTHPVGDPDFAPLNNINQAVSGAAGLIRQLLAFARQQTVRPQLIEISAELSDLSVLLRNLLDDAITLDVVHGRELPFVKMDRTQLQTCIMNLATNARDAMRQRGGGELTIRSARATHAEISGRHEGVVAEGDYAVIEVRDNGPGMSQQTLEKIFEPFFTTKESGRGTGLGLATVFGIVKQAGGHVVAESELGRGAAFRIFLPAYAPSEDELADFRSVERAAAERARKPSDVSGDGKILFVEDNDAVRESTKLALTRLGYDVVSAEDGEEALEYLEDNPGSIDLLISDVMMPVMDGPTMLENARQYLGDAKVIFISGFAEEQLDETLRREPHVRFLAKPFDTKRLAELAKSVLTEG